MQTNHGPLVPSPLPPEKNVDCSARDFSGGNDARFRLH